MTTFTKPVLRELRNQLQTLLDNSKYIGTAQGLNDYTFEIGNCSYDGGEATFKLKVLIKGAKSQADIQFEQMAKLSDFDTDKISSLQSMAVKLVGFKSRSTKRPWIIQDVSNDKQYVIDGHTAKRLFGTVAEVS